MFFNLNTAALAVALTLIMGGSVAVGVLAGRSLAKRPDSSRESVGVVQGTLLGLVGLLLAFGLTMAVGRYESRRALVVQEANSIGTTYLRAQMLAEPERTTTLDLLQQYADDAIVLADAVPESAEFTAAQQRLTDLQFQLWRVAGDAVAADPVGTATRLYIETLNETIDTNTERVASLRNRVPLSVSFLQVVGSAVALAVLSLYLTLLGRGITTSLVAAVVVVFIIFVSFDLDRPQRGFITVPIGLLEDVRESMDGPPAVTPP